MWLADLLRATLINYQFWRTKRGIKVALHTSIIARIGPDIGPNDGILKRQIFTDGRGDNQRSN